MWWALLSGLGCTPPLEGRVESQGQPVAGVTLAAPGCSLVSDASGRVAGACPPGVYALAVAHPDYLPQTVEVTVPSMARPGGAVSLPPLSLVPLPKQGGLYLARPGEAYLALPVVPLREALLAEGAERSFCVEGALPPLPEVPVGASLLDVHAVDWELYAIGEDGCILRMKQLPSGYWTADAQPLQIPPEAKTEEGPGRHALRVSVPPGRYLAVWVVDGVMAVESDGRLQAWGLQVSAK